MRRLLLSALPFALVIVACKGNREREVLGAWQSQQGMKITVAADKTYKDDSGVLHATGTWRLDDGDVVFTPTTINGRPVSEIKTRLQENVGRFSSARRPFVEKMMRDIDRPNFLTLSPDGKTMTTDRAKDQNEDPWTPLTKE